MGIYDGLSFPPAFDQRPYTFLNMVSTLDGKIISGERNESVSDLGSKVDHETMRFIERAADALILGAHTLRTAGNWNPSCPTKVVVTSSGDLPYSRPFFRDGRSVVVALTSSQVPDHVECWRFQDSVDFARVLERLHADGVDRLLLLGGSELNAQFFRLGFVDEIFLTLAPKIKMGQGTPTIADGTPFGRAEMPQFELIESHVVQDEVFLRYRKRSA
jgi:riboflavin biosynthesis pyrimidine reductase